MASTTDRAVTWAVISWPTFSGAVYGAAVVPGLPGYYVAVWAVAFASRHARWAVGVGGRVVKIGVEGARGK